MTTTKTTTRRYTTACDDFGVVILRVHADCALGNAGDVRRFSARSGGYVYEWKGADCRQVCGGLYRHGATLSAREGDLLAVIRREARRALRDEARAEARY
jgi:hypothetical protein